MAQEKYDPELIEQPVPAWNVEGLRAVTNSTDIPFSTNESVLNFHDALRVVQEKAADLINIKVSRSKGIFHSMKIAHIAEAAGVKVLVGSMMETGIGTVASANLATLFASELATELVGPLYFKEDIIRPMLTFTEGVLTLPPGPGFGIQIDYEKLSDCRIWSMSI